MTFVHIWRLFITFLLLLSNGYKCPKLATMVGENVNIYLSQVAANPLTLSTMVGENFEIYFSQMAIYAPKLSTMVGEHFEIYCDIFRLDILWLFYDLFGVLLQEGKFYDNFFMTSGTPA